MNAVKNLLVYSKYSSWVSGVLESCVRGSGSYFVTEFDVELEAGKEEVDEVRFVYETDRLFKVSATGIADTTCVVKRKNTVTAAGLKYIILVVLVNLCQKTVFFLKKCQ